MSVYKNTLEERKKKHLEKRLSYFTISYDVKNQRYELIDDFVLETMYLKVEGNNFIVCDGGSLTTRHRNFIKEFLIKEKILPE